jgi:Collagen triple helix repeat (20 copies)
MCVGIHAVPQAPGRAPSPGRRTRRTVPLGPTGRPTQEESGTVNKRIGLLAAGGLTVALVALGGTALAANAGGSPVSSTGVITGCYSMPNGNGTSQLTLQNGGTSCPKGMSAISWNQTGPQGPAGPTGPTGATGATGATGPTGPAGVQGVPGQQGPGLIVGAAALAACPNGGVQVSDEYSDVGNICNGAPGATGPAGPTGATGPQGPAGQNGVSGYNIVEAPGVNSDYQLSGYTEAQYYAECPAGQVVIGGGWDGPLGSITLNGDGPGPEINGSFPAESWAIDVYNNSIAFNDVDVWALCANAS